MSFNRYCKMSVITCESCGMEIVLSPKYDDFEGKVECESCKSVSKVKIEAGKPEKVKLDEKVALV